MINKKKIAVLIATMSVACSTLFATPALAYCFRDQDSKVVKSESKENDEFFSTKEKIDFYDGDIVAYMDIEAENHASGEVYIEVYLEDKKTKIAQCELMSTGMYTDSEEYYGIIDSSTKISGTHQLYFKVKAVDESKQSKIDTLMISAHLCLDVELRDNVVGDESGNAKIYDNDKSVKTSKTNVGANKVELDDSPKTADDISNGLYLVGCLGAFSLIGVSVIIIILRKKKDLFSKYKM